MRIFLETNQINDYIKDLTALSEHAKKSLQLLPSPARRGTNLQSLNRCIDLIANKLENISNNYNVIGEAIKKYLENINKIENPELMTDYYRMYRMPLESAFIIPKELYFEGKAKKLNITMPNYGNLNLDNGTNSYNSSVNSFSANGNYNSFAYGSGSVLGTAVNVGSVSATSPSTTESIPSVSGTITGETVTATVAGPSDAYKDVTITPELQSAYGNLVMLCDRLDFGRTIDGTLLTSIEEWEAYRKEIADLFDKYPGLELATKTGDLVDRDEDFINAYNRVMELYRITGSGEGYDNKVVLATTDEERQEVANQIQELLSKYPSLRQLIVNQKLDYLKSNPNVENNDKLTNLDFLLGIELIEGKSLEGLGETTKETENATGEFNYLDHIEEIKKEPLAFFFNNPQYFFEKKDLDQYLNDLKENNINIYELDLASGLEGGKNTVDEDSIRNILSLRMEQVLSDPNASAELKSTIERYITPDGHILYGNENYELEEILKDYLTDGEKQYIKDVRHILDDVIKEEDSNYVEVTTLTPNDNYLDYVDDIKNAPLTFYYQNRNYFDNHGVKGEITENTDMGLLQYKEYLDSIIPIIGEENLDKVDLANGISQFGAVKENVQTLYQTKAYLLANSPKVSEEEKKDLLDYFYGIPRDDSKANDIIQSYLTDHEREYEDNIDGVFNKTVTENLESNSVG